MTMLQYKFNQKFYYLICIFYLCMIFSCGDHRYPQQLLTADSLTEVNPDSAVALLRQLSPQMQHERKAVRMYHRLLTVKAADKADQLQPVPDSILPIVKYYESRGDKHLLPTAYYYAGRTYYEIHNDSLALRFYLLAESAIKDDYKLLSVIYSQIAYLYYNQNVSTKALEYHRKSYQSSVMQNDTSDALYALRDIAYLFQKMEQFDSCKATLLRAERLAELVHDKNRLTDIKFHLASTYSDLEEHDSAIYVINTVKNKITPLDAGASYSTLSKVYYNAGQYDSAMLYCKKVLQAGNIYGKRAAHKRLADIYGNMGLTKEATWEIKEYEKCEDSIQRATHPEELFLAQEAHSENTRDSERKSTYIIMLSVLLCSAVTLFLLSRLWLTRRERQSKTKGEKMSVYVSSQDSENHEMANIAPEIIQSPLYKLIQYIANNDDKKVEMTTERWAMLDEMVNKFHPGFREGIYGKVRIKVKTYRICLLMKIGMPTSAIARILDSKDSAISSQKAFLGKKIEGESGNAQSWNNFIQSL